MAQPASEPAVLYQRSVPADNSSELGFRGHFVTIQEIWLPQRKLAFNLFQGTVHVYHSESMFAGEAPNSVNDRVPLNRRDIQVLSATAEKLDALLRLNEQRTAVMKDVMKDVKAVVSADNLLSQEDADL